MPAVGLGRGSAHHVAGGGTTPFFALGDSHTLGALGGTGGYRQFVTRLGVSRGPYTDVTGGRKHAGISGNRLDQMGARFMADWTGNEAPMILMAGGTNDIAQGAAATDARDRFVTMRGIMAGEVGTALPTYVFTPPTINHAIDPTIMTAQLLIQQAIAVERAAGTKVYMLDAGRFLTAASGDLDGTGGGAGEHPIDGTYGAQGVGTGYGKLAYYIDRYFDATRAKDPSQLTGLTLEGWYRGDDVNQTGGVIDQFNDKSSNARHAAGTSTQRPTYTASGALGQPCATFNGTTNVLRTGTGFTISQPFFAFVVMGAAGNNSGAFIESAGSSARCTCFGSGAGNGISINAGSTVTDNNINPQTVAHAYLIHYNGASSRIWVDGVERRISLSVGTNGQNGFGIGATYVPSNYVSGEIYETAYLTGSVDTAQVHDLFMYAAQRYGIFPTSPLVLPTW